MKNLFFPLSIVCLTVHIQAMPIQKTNTITLSKGEKGWTLLVDEKPFLVKGMNWEYIPIGENYKYSLWAQDDSFIKKTLDYEMGLLRDINVNTIRVLNGIPPIWIEYIFNNYGIFTVVNHTFGRYGIEINNQWIPKTDYSDPTTHRVLLNEILELTSKYQNVRGLLFYLIGNENNYGIFWDGAETEDIPTLESASQFQAVHLYSLMEKAVKIIKGVDKEHPVAICNGDLQYLDIIKEKLLSADILGTNVYRGHSFTDLFESTSNNLDKPILITEFGSDAYDSIKKDEDGATQALYLKNNWKEILLNTSTFNGNVIGGMTFQFSDGWWKAGQDINLEIQDTSASWANAGYNHDFIPGQNNMNEEWFGIMARTKIDSAGISILVPRESYHLLKSVHEIDPYEKNVSKALVEKYFSKIDISLISKTINSF